MLGLMQDWPLVCHKIIDFAARQHPNREVVSRSVEGPVVRTTYTDIRLRSKKIAQLLAREGLPADRVATVGYSEPSLVFLSGTAITFTDVAGAVRHLAGGPDRAVLIGDRDRARFLAAAAGLSPVAGPAVRGFNYSRGRWTELTLYRPG